MNIRLIILILLMLFNLNLGFAQDDTKTDKDGKVEEVIDWAWPGRFLPYIEVSAGSAQLNQDKFAGQMPEEQAIELKLGYSQLKEADHNLWELDQRYIYGSYMADNIFSGGDGDNGDFVAKISRFGFGSRLGYGYSLGQFVLILYNQNGLNWTQIRASDYDSLSTEDLSILERYEGTYRFGMNTEGGISFEIVKSLSLTGAYEIAVVYPRHVFWPWLGSNMLFQIALGIVSGFTDDIIESSPVAGPIFYFLLKNGISYAYYQGVKDKMNWPFNSETPLMINTFKFGLSYTF